VASIPEYAGRTMAAYAVIARIGRVEPHLTLHHLDRVVAPGDASDAIEPTDDMEVTVADVWASDAGPIAARLIRLRELWTQTTFYLFDAESWRS